MEQSENDINLDADQCFESGDIFYSITDKKNLRFAIKALVQDRLGLAIIGNNESLLTHYSRMLIFRLRKLNKFQMDIFSPTDTNSLLDRFNEMLASMTMKQARQQPDPEVPATLLVVNDANAVDEEQWVLLMRLLKDFPGINVRLILFLNKNNWPGYDQVLRPISRQLHRWHLHLPSIPEATALIESARDKGYEEQTKQLLSNVGLSFIFEKTAVVDEGGSDQQRGNLAASRALLLAQTQSAQKAQKDKSDQNRVSRLSGVGSKILLLFVVISVSLAVVAQLNPVGAEKYKGYLFSIIATPSTTNEQAQMSEPDLKRVVLEEPSEALPSQPIEEDGENIEDKVEVATASKTMQGTTEVESSVKPTLISTTLVAEDQPIVETSPMEVVMVESETLSGAKQPILTSLPKDSFFVQHAVVTGSTRLASYIEKNPVLKNASTLAITANGQQAYAIISGPFLSKLEAVGFTENPLIPPDFWIWESSQLFRWCKRNESCQLSFD
ncbi:MAG: hypothetical protein P8Q37_10900 [Porticoccaceae bacterium]|nr:hypothetical protein [Porticoccaceae bacterium]